jgi:hypothetical protein
MDDASKCWWCGREATLLCDALIGCERRKSDNTLIIDETYTCDAELCRGCAIHRGHISGEEPDSIDVCPAHREEAIGGAKLAELATTKVEVGRIRRDIYAAARRSRLRVVDAEGGR